MTSYKIFRQTKTEGTDGTVYTYEPIGQYTANDAKGAIKAAVLGLPADLQAKAATELFAATPSAYWTEEAPKVDTITTVTFA